MSALKPLKIYEYTYVYLDKHRNKSYNTYSCRWTITFNEEGGIFKDCVDNKYFEICNSKTLGYNLSKIKNDYRVIGMNCNYENLKLSKFIISGKCAHGYPADYANRCQDKPNDNTLLKMKDNGLIDNLILKKILKGRNI